MTRGIQGRSAKEAKRSRNLTLVKATRDRERFGELVGAGLAVGGQRQQFPGTHADTHLVAGLNFALKWRRNFGSSTISKPRKSCLCALTSRIASTT